MLSGATAIILQLAAIYILVKIALKFTKFLIKLAFYILALAVALNVLRILVGTIALVL